MSRTVEMTVYQMNELSEKMKEVALNHMNERFDYRTDDNEKTMAEFENIFNVDVHNWEYDQRNYEYQIYFNDHGNKDIENLSDLRLYKYIQNNISDHIFKGKYYSTNMKYVNGKLNYKHRHSKIMLENSCVLTGYFLDDDILDPVYDYLKNPDLSMTYKDLLEKCLDNFFEAIQGEMEGHYSFNSMAEMAEINEIEFLEDGSIYDIVEYANEGI